MKAKFVSVWDGGIEIKTDCECEYKKDTKPKMLEVWNIEQADVDGLDLDTFVEEYVLLPDGEEVKEFDNLDN